MLDLNSIAVDPKKVNEGVWVTVFGAKVKLARHSNQKAELARAAGMLKYYEKLSEMKEGDTIPEDLQDQVREVNLRAMAEHVILDWKGVGIGGVEVPYTPEACFNIISDSKYADFYQRILHLSTQHDNYSAKVEEKVKKQVKTSASS